ncbi:MAG: PEP-CTERM sorting domain-containing protein, partial [Aeoliella sp.]
VGDITTRALGDFDFDGFIGLADWHILRINHENGASLNLGELLAGNPVPEPASYAPAIIALVGLGGLRARRPVARASGTS